jgi:signal transduction histidine kinase
VSPAQTIAVALYLFPALLWTIIARQLWVYRRVRRPQSGAFRLAPIVATVVAVHFFLLLGFALAPGGFPVDPRVKVASPGQGVHEVCWLVTLALLRHLLRLVPLPERPPRRGWLAFNYGLVALVVAADLALRLAPGAGPAQRLLAHRLYEGGFLVLGALCLWEVVRVARPGPWGPEHAGELRRPDVVLLAWGVGAAFLLVPLAFLGGGASVALAFFEAALGLAIAAPFVLRMLGGVVTELFVALLLVAAAGAVVAGHGAVAARAGQGFAPLVALAAALALALALPPLAGWLRARATRLFLRRGLRQQEELRRFLHTLSPELGVVECCRRALAELARVRRLPGAAVILRDGEAIVHGDFDVAPLRAVWPRGEGADALPARSFGTAELRELPRPLRDALTAANVGLGVAPILGPRGRWGHLFMNTGLLGGLFRDEDWQDFEAFVAQLALVLDATDLLARALAVERALAHAEKLAAMGELAARIAHEIRNPVTAARSLAQQLAREPGSPFGEEPALILIELERVERQVQALLRFARREEYAFAAVDLGALARAAVEGFAPRLAAAGVSLDLDVASGVEVRADAEKLRQVLVNLLDNALDALADAPRRRLSLAVADGRGGATLRVADSGPGVPAEALERLFEPFFSLKPSGTGLGLAISKRIVAAHGGRITARPGDPGLVVEVELPARR